MREHNTILISNLAMNKTHFIVVLAILIATPLFSFGQDDNTDELFELSPFVVDSRRSYSAGRARNAKVDTVEFFDLGSSIDGIVDSFNRASPTSDPSVPIHLVKPADEMSIQFAISFFDDLEETRKNKLREFLEKAKQAIDSNSDLRFTPGPLLIAEGDRKKIKGKKKSAYTSHAHFSVSFDLQSNDSVYGKIRDVKQLVDDLELNSDVTRVFYGAVNLVLEDPNQYRMELLDAVFEDASALADKLDGKFEIYPVGLEGRVQLKQHSESEVELWIPYKYEFVSVRQMELEDKRLLLDHELALRASCCSKKNREEEAVSQ